MIRYLIERPVAVMMSFLAAIILGILTYFTLPVSLLPDIAIPEITVQVSAEGYSARQLESSVVRPLRSSLLQLTSKRDITSSTSDGLSVIRIRFDYGTNTDFAFIEVNEKIDHAMGSLPKDVQRPRVIKASATDIPVFNLNLTLKNERGDKDEFLQLSDFASSVIKNRLEQLPEVAMVDVSGLQKREVEITPDNKKLSSLGLSRSDIERALTQNNVEPGSMIIRDGYYQYNVKFSSVIRTVDDIKDIYINKQGRLFKISELAHIELVPQKSQGYSYFGEKPSVVFSVIKQSDVTMQQLKKSVEDLMDDFHGRYKDVEFNISQNQTELLDYTMSNLKGNLLLGFVLIVLLSIIFFKDLRTPAVISLGMIVSLVISMLFYFLFDLTFNIISLSGLILALGMMIDSSIIVTDNISQYTEKGLLLPDACVKGTNEIITPLLSSSLTTVAVFAPLVFISGIAGALFLDQALSVSIGLGVSYIVAIIFLPVAYKIFFGSRLLSKLKLPSSIEKFYPTDPNAAQAKVYDRIFDFVFRNKKAVLMLCLMFIPLSYLMFVVIEKRKMPFLDHTESVVMLNWGPNTHVDENRKRTFELLHHIKDDATGYSAQIGVQQFILQSAFSGTGSDAKIYIQAKNTDELLKIEDKIKLFVDKKYPQAKLVVSPAESVFEKIFSTSEKEFTANVFLKKSEDMSDHIDSLGSFVRNIEKLTGGKAELGLSDQVNLWVDRSALMLYDVDFSELQNILKTLFGENQVTLLRSNDQYLPIVISGREGDLYQSLSGTTVRTQSSREEVSISNFVRISPSKDLSVINSDENGEYIPLNYTDVKNHKKLSREIKALADNNNTFDVRFSGSVFSNNELMSELGLVLLISLLLLYFILAAQFESLTQPLFVLMEIPIDIGASLLFLWIFSNSLNIMSAIGIIVSCGIIINDSILKIDIINKLRKDGMPVLQAIHTAGHRRLRAIVMTSLTTILAMVPILFTKDMGSELQAPLAIAIMGGMTVGTFVSLFVVPLVYWLVYNKNDKNKKVEI